MPSDTVTVRTDPESPRPEIIRKAARTIVGKKVVVFPTRYLYGLAADAFSPEAVKKVFSLKRRPFSNPMLILIHSRERLEALVTSIPSAAEKLMDNFWPGNATLVFEAGKELPDVLTAGTGKIGIRLPGHPVARALVRELGTPITGTSANLSGRTGCHRIRDIDPQILGSAGMVLDAGTLENGIGSTVVDITGVAPRIVRPGETPADAIYEACL